MARVLGGAIAALTLLTTASPCLGQDLEAAFAVRDDASTIITLGLGFSSLLSLSRTPDESHGLGGRLRGAVSYVDDDKMATFEIAAIDYHTIYRPERDRYEAGSLPTVALFSLTSQLRVTERFHLLYGAALGRSGTFTHAASGGLAFNLGTALPLLFRGASTMREYRRAHLQIEVLPLVGSLLTNLLEEGFYDTEHPTVQVQGEVALTGRVETSLGTITAETRLSASYVHQRSMYLRIAMQWVGPTFWRRVAISAQSRVILPLRPMRRHISENAQLIFYEPNVALSLGIVVYLDAVPAATPNDSARRQRLRDQRQERRQERRERRAQRIERYRQRTTRPRLR